MSGEENLVIDEFKVPECPDVLDFQEDELIDYLADPVPTPLLCQQCEEEFDSFNELKNHSKSIDHHINSFCKKVVVADARLPLV